MKVTWTLSWLKGVNRVNGGYDLRIKLPNLASQTRAIFSNILRE
jgi:hypothetical protein